MFPKQSTQCSTHCGSAIILILNNVGIVFATNDVGSHLSKHGSLNREKVT